MNHFTTTISDLLAAIDRFVWGVPMLTLLAGAGIFLTVRTQARCLRNLPYALRAVLNPRARQKSGTGDVSSFCALTTALAATIGTGNIVGVATAMVSGGPGALVWMWISAAFGITTKFSECMLAVKYRELNNQGEMSGGPMYTMKKAFRHKKLGAALGWLFALFAVLASFGIGNLTQANSIAAALGATYHIPAAITGVILAVLTLCIIFGGIQSISKVSQIVVPVMAGFYILSGIVVIFGNRQNIPSGAAMIFKMAFSLKAVGGGLCGAITASLTQSLRFGVARGVFSNEAGMGSAAITAAAASTDDPVRQGYINMTATFWDTLVVCTITGLCIASSGVLGSTQSTSVGSYYCQNNQLIITSSDVDGKSTTTVVRYALTCTSDTVTLTEDGTDTSLTLTRKSEEQKSAARPLSGTWADESGNIYLFDTDAKGSYEYRALLQGSVLTIRAFETVLGDFGGALITIAIALFAFSTILGWEYQGEKAFEYLFGARRFRLPYRVFFSLLTFLGATTTLQIAWTFSDIANALMAIPNLICLLSLSSLIQSEIERYQPLLEREKKRRP